MSFTWIPIYEQLADKLVGWRDRQGELVAFLRTLADKKLLVISLEDKGAKGAQPLAEIDPFTFFAVFNRGLRTENRQALMAEILRFLGLDPGVPTDFDGIPVVDLRRSWFFPYAKDRKPDDIPSLWDLFAQAVRGGPAGVDAATFDRCLSVKTVGLAKLTMGLFWVRPRAFLPVDSRTREYLENNRIEVPSTASWTDYQSLTERVRGSLGSDFAAISVAAYEGKEPAPEGQRYWAGGHQFGEESQLQRFKDTRRWEIGWPKDATTKGAKGAWERIGHIRPGDLFAIKGYGGRNHLRIHEVARVVAVDADTGKLTFEPIARELFRGKAPGPPGDGTWFETLVEVSNPDAVAAIFGAGTSTPRKATPDLPLNLILYGPPGTGKTWELLRHIRPRFDLDDAVPVRSMPDVAGLTWFQVVALAL
ncbi:MAG: ATP-binding protein, partial [Alphaproteobacteria bacterium]|nr:ATP-binding protein [Alphaproteobacteria bacterium]